MAVIKLIVFAAALSRRSSPRGRIRILRARRASDRSSNCSIGCANPRAGGGSTARPVVHAVADYDTQERICVTRRACWISRRAASTAARIMLNRKPRAGAEAIRRRCGPGSAAAAA